MTGSGQAAFLAGPALGAVRAPGAGSAVCRHRSTVRMTDESAAQAAMFDQNEKLIEQRDGFRVKDYSLKSDADIPVRFINGPGKKDVVVVSKAGKNLMALGDECDIRIPRSCRTGLCGSCTSDLEDPNFPECKQTIRACCTEVALPEGCKEMVIDLFRMEGSTLVKAQTRFDDIDTKYVAGAAPRSPTGRLRTIAREMTCVVCTGNGRHVCVECDGSGIHPDDESYPCLICMGRSSTRCADCQGTGVVKFR